MVKNTRHGASGSSGVTERIPSLTASLEELHSNAMADPEGRTGRMIAVFLDDADDVASQAMHESFAVRSAHSRDFAADMVDFSALGDADALTFDHLGIAVLGASAAHAAYESVLRQSDDAGIATDRPFILVPETIEWIQTDTASYLRGFRAAADRIASDLADILEPDSPGRVRDTGGLAATAAETWGLSATRVSASSFSGRGIRVAILDTGLDFGHPDFVGRRILAQSFITGETPEDGNGHGTHVAGTACGPRVPQTQGVRYGIAHDCDVLVAKVLSNSGSGSTASILAGINWALANGAHVLNMSLGNRNGVPAPHYTQAGQRALSQGAIIVAAAGNFNESTGQPANSPTILSVSSVTSALDKSGFSNFGKVELAGPGSSVESALPRPRLRGFLSGTSMAAPHVSGIAALHAQGHGLRGQALWNHLQATARRLSLPPSQMGAGLVQA